LAVAAAVAPTWAAAVALVATLQVHLQQQRRLLTLLLWVLVVAAITLVLETAEALRAAVPPSLVEAKT
jgi:hypothetical protein